MLVIIMGQSRNLVMYSWAKAKAEAKAKAKARAKAKASMDARTHQARINPTDFHAMVRAARADDGTKRS